MFIYIFLEKLYFYVVFFRKYLNMCIISIYKNIFEIWLIIIKGKGKVIEDN